MDSMLRSISSFCRYALSAFIALVVASQPAFAATVIRFVDVSVSTAGNGSDWSSPMKYLSDAITYLETNMNGALGDAADLAGATTSARQFWQ
jgi:hypothetical protein